MYGMGIREKERWRGEERREEKEEIYVADCGVVW